MVPVWKLIHCSLTDHTSMWNAFDYHHSWQCLLFSSEVIWDSHHLISIQRYWFGQDLRAVHWWAACAVYAQSSMPTGQLAPLRFNPWSTRYLIFTLVNSHFILFRYLDNSLLDKFVPVTSTKQRYNCIQTINNYLLSGSLQLSDMSLSVYCPCFYAFVS